ncbi:MAG: hypothetical protein KKB70_02170 [Proteobacteria bacterium]|nr:hypothetical protein [Pseudomonadota bacterium]
MHNSTLTIALAVRDHDTRRELDEAVRSMDGLALGTGSEMADILIFEVTRGQEKEFLQTRKGLAEQVSGEIFLVCADPHPKFLIAAMRAGVQEVLPLPLERKEFARALSRFRERSATHAETVATPGQGRVIGILGARPGVGATTLAVNLALELQRQGNAALVDMAVPLGEAPLFLDLEYSYTWGDVAQNLSRLDASYLGGVMPRHASGLSLLASPGEGYLPPEAAQAMGQIIEELRRDFVHTVIDTDALLSPMDLKELDRADEVILVMNLTLPCLAHAQRLADTLRRLESGGANIRIAVNRHLRDSDIMPAEAEEILGRKITWIIPEDSQAVTAAVNQGRPLAESAPKSPATKAIATMARALTGTTIAPARTSGLGSLFRRRNNEIGNLAGAEAL